VSSRYDRLLRAIVMLRELGLINNERADMLIELVSARTTEERLKVLAKHGLLPEDRLRLIERLVKVRSRAEVVKKVRELLGSKA